MAQTSPETNKQAAFRLLDEVYNTGRTWVIDEICARNIVVHTNVGGDLDGVKAFKEFVKSYLDAFEGIHLHVDEIKAESEMVDVHATLSATNAAPFLGIPPTHKRSTAKPIFLFRFNTNGKVIEHWQERIF